MYCHEYCIVYIVMSESIVYIEEVRLKFEVVSFCVKRNYSIWSIKMSKICAPSPPRRPCAVGRVLACDACKTYIQPYAQSSQKSQLAVPGYRIPPVIYQAHHTEAWAIRWGWPSAARLT